jgi:hypothetical protein
MLQGMHDAKQKSVKIVDQLNNHDKTKTHARHIHIDEAVDMGLTICKLEENHKLQDLVLTIHHSFMHTYSNSNAIKIVENHAGNAIVFSAR